MTRGTRLAMACLLLGASPLASCADAAVSAQDAIALRVVAAPASRVAAKQVPAFCEDLTPAAEYEKARRQPVQQFLARAKGSGRPTKRDRRAIERLFE